MCKRRIPHTGVNMKFRYLMNAPKWNTTPEAAELAHLVITNYLQASTSNNNYLEMFPGAECPLMHLS